MKLSKQIESVLVAAIENLRQTPFVPFWKASIDLTPDKEMAKFYRDTSKLGNRVREEFEIAASKKKFNSFDLIIREGNRHYYDNSQSLSIHAKLKHDSEWDAVLGEAWRGADNPNKWFLTDNALRMLSWLQGPKNTGEFLPENKIGAQAGLRGSGSYSEIRTYLKEISLKSPYQVIFESTSRWRGDYKAKIELKTEKVDIEEFNNPVFARQLWASDQDSVTAFTEILKDGILQSNIADTEPFILFNIRSRADLLLAFPDLANNDDFSPHEFEKFLEKVRLTRGLEAAATLSDVASKGWRLGAVLKDGWTWKRAKQAILDQRQRENPEKTYGLSSKAAKILEWIMDLHEDEIELGMTPSVEDKSDEQMGIKGLEYDQNSKAILMILINEINELTPYTLQLIPWKYCGREYHRILIRRDTKNDEDLIKKIQIQGLNKGVKLSTSQIEQMLKDLWKSGTSF